MTRTSHAVALAALIAAFASPVTAACYADYRARTADNPVQFHYGVIEIPESDCSEAAAFAVIARRIAAEGWELLDVISVFDESGLDARRSDAGANFLRF